MTTREKVKATRTVCEIVGKTPGLGWMEHQYYVRCGRKASREHLWIRLRLFWWSTQKVIAFTLVMVGQIVVSTLLDNVVSDHNKLLWVQGFVLVSLSIFTFSFFHQWEKYVENDPTKLDWKTMGFADDVLRLVSLSGASGAEALPYLVGTPEEIYVQRIPKHLIDKCIRTLIRRAVRIKDDEDLLIRGRRDLTPILYSTAFLLEAAKKQFEADLKLCKVFAILPEKMKADDLYRWAEEIIDARK